MRIKIPCPVCGNISYITRKLDNIWGSMVVSEEYFVCQSCSYFRRLSDSITTEGIVEGFPVNLKGKVSSYNIKVYSEEERSKLPF